jgi:hypothetical protein
VSGVDSKRAGVGAVEPFDECLGGEGSATGREDFDSRGLVHFVAERRDFAATAGEDPPDIQGRAPGQTEPQREFGLGDVASGRDVA